jgi:hypothetical protein
MAVVPTDLDIREKIPQMMYAADNTLDARAESKTE